MTIREAIQGADTLRPNAFSDLQKTEWLCALDGQLAETMGKDAPAEARSQETELLMPVPHDRVYVLYLVSMIDYYNQDTDLYENDRTIFNAALAEAKAWWRRNNRSASRGNWRTT